MTAAMAQGAKQMRELGDLVQRTTSEMSERMTQIEGRMRLHDQRFDKMLSAVEGAIQANETFVQGQLEDLKRRVTRLEQKSDSAA